MALFENAFKSCFDKTGEEAVVSLNKLATFVTSFFGFPPQGRGVEREREAGFLLSREPYMGINLRIPGSWPEPRQTLNHLTY